MFHQNTWQPIPQEAFLVLAYLWTGRVGHFQCRVTRAFCRSCENWDQLRPSPAGWDPFWRRLGDHLQRFCNHSNTVCFIFFSLCRRSIKRVMEFKKQGYQQVWWSISWKAWTKSPNRNGRPLWQVSLGPRGRGRIWLQFLDGPSLF